MTENGQHFVQAPCLPLILSSPHSTLAKFSSCPPPPIRFFILLLFLPCAFPACIIATSHSREEEVGLLKLDIKARNILPSLPFRYKGYVMGFRSLSHSLFLSLFFFFKSHLEFLAPFYSWVWLEAYGLSSSQILPLFPLAWFDSEVGVFVVLICRSSAIEKAGLLWELLSNQVNTDVPPHTLSWAFSQVLWCR